MSRKSCAVGMCLPFEEVLLISITRVKYPSHLFLINFSARVNDTTRSKNFLTVIKPLEAYRVNLLALQSKTTSSFENQSIPSITSN